MVQAAPILDFVGRTTELARLRVALDRARIGRGAMVIVAGEAGIGKSRLIDRLGAEVVDGWRIVRGSCLELTAGELPYAPFVEAFRELIRGMAPERRPALLGPGRADLERLLPELATRAPADPSPAAIPDPLAQHRLFEVILGVVERLARESPVVLVVEDLQWADRSSLDLVGFLGRALRDDRVLMIVTVRSEALGQRAPLLSAVAEWERAAHVERVDLIPFGSVDIAAQIAGLGVEPEPDLVAGLAARTDGNPFFIDQLIRSGVGLATGHPGGRARTSVVSEIPNALNDVLIARIATLTDGEQEVLRAASAAGRRIDDTLLATSLERQPSEIAAALRRIVDAGMLVREATGGGYRFRHALLREVVYAELFSGERSRLHRAIGDVLEARSQAGDATVSPGEIAHHRDAAGDVGPALVATLAAARSAEQAYASQEADRLFDRAIDLWLQVPDAPALTGTDHVAVLERAAEAAMTAGDAPRAVQRARAALAGLDATVDPLRAGVIHERLRWFLWEAGDRAAAAEAVREALRLIPAALPSAARARVLAHVAGIELYGRDYKASREHAAQALDIARSVGARSEEALALGILGWDEAVLGDVEGGVARFIEGQRIADELRSPEGQALAATNLAALLDRVGRPVDSLAAAQAGLDTVRRLGVARTYGGLLAGYAVKALVALGRWDEAETAASAGLREAAADRAVLWLLANRARLHVGRGRFDEAAADIRRATTLDDALGTSEFRMNVLAASAEAACWQGRIAEVRSIIDTVGGMAEPAGPPDPALAWLAALGLRAEADGAATARARHDEPALEMARRRAAAIVAALDQARADPATQAIVSGSSRGQGLSLLCAAEARRVERADTSADWASVASAWASAERPFPEAYARFREAESILAARGDRHAAEAALRAADATARALGAEPLRESVQLLARHARIELEPKEDRIVHGSPQVAGDGAAATYGFTERELEVLRLVAGGWSNQQIGDTLFISRKTASVHVSNIMGKLDVRSRVEAAAVAHRLGLGLDAPGPPGST